MTKILNRIDVIIPFADTLEELKCSIESLEIQDKFINKLLIVISGNQIDKNIFLVTELVKTSRLFRKIVLLKDDNENKTPGSARNLGIKNSFADYIGFLDSGMIANKEWISSFLQSKKSIRLGSTIYAPRKGFQTLSAFLTYGTRCSINSLPGTIIEKSICINFDDSLRYGEDILWKLNYKKFENIKLETPCKYIFFPDNLKSLIRKFYFLNIYGLRFNQTRQRLYLQTFISIIFFAIILSLFFLNKSLLSSLFLFFYLFLKFLYKNRSSYLLSKNLFLFGFFQLSFDLLRILIIIKTQIKKLDF